MAEALDIAPLILAAGASIRMGRPKALMTFDGKTCLDLALDAVRGLGTPIVVLGAAREEIQERVKLGSVQIAINDDYERGQTSSLRVGLACLSPSAVAFLLYPVDFPLVSAGDVGRIVKAFRTCKNPEKAAFIPSYNMQRGHPVLFRRDVVAEFLALPDEAPARTIIDLRPQRISYVDFEQANILMDMDTPEDYRRCLEAYRARQHRRSR